MIKWKKKVGERTRERLSRGGRKDYLQEIKKNNNNKYIDFSKQMLLTLNLKLHSDGEDAEEVLNLGDRENSRKHEQEAEERGRRGESREGFFLSYSPERAHIFLLSTAHYAF